MLFRSRANARASSAFVKVGKACPERSSRISLGRSVRSVVTQPVDRAGAWGVLAAYDYQQAGQTYRISQLYLSDRGVLRTVTGSAALKDAGACVNEMRDFIRYLAN